MLMLSHDTLSFPLPTIQPPMQSKGVNRKKRFMSSLKRVSHSSRRAKRRLCCKLQFWMWRKRRRAKCHFWILKAKKQEKGTCLISSSPSLGLKTRSQKQKGKVKKYHAQNLEKLKGKKSLLAVECDPCGSQPSEPAGLSEICSTNNFFQNLATGTNIVGVATNQNMPTVTMPSQTHGKESSIRLDELPDPPEQCHAAKSTNSKYGEITDKEISKKQTKTQTPGSQKLSELGGPSEQRAAITKLQNQAACRAGGESSTSKNMLRQTVSSENQRQADVGYKELAKEIHEFLDDFYRIYGSFIPLQKSDVLKHLQRKFNTDFDKRKNFVSSEVTRHRAAIVLKPVPSFHVVYRKHTLTLDDLSTLADQNWLNDQVMNMYGDLITESSHHKVHFLNSFFHRQLVTKGYEGVKRWTKQVDLFSKSLLLVPIHLEVHWCLVTADIVNKRIYLYDSQGTMLQKVAKNILKYLMIEAKERQQAAFQKGWTLSLSEGVPQQTNENDCGVFVLEYCRCLALGKPLQFTQRDIPSIRKRIYKELCDCKLYE